MSLRSELIYKRGQNKKNYSDEKIIQVLNEYLAENQKLKGLVEYHELEVLALNDLSKNFRSPK